LEATADPILAKLESLLHESAEGFNTVNLPAKGFSVEGFVNLLIALDRDIEIRIRRKLHSPKAAGILVTTA
jgi:hypothetical protein